MHFSSARPPRWIGAYSYIHLSYELCNIHAQLHRLHNVYLYYGRAEAPKGLEENKRPGWGPSRRAPRAAPGSGCRRGGRGAQPLPSRCSLAVCVSARVACSVLSVCVPAARVFAEVCFVQKSTADPKERSDADHETLLCAAAPPPVSQQIGRFSRSRSRCSRKHASPPTQSQLCSQLQLFEFLKIGQTQLRDNAALRAKKPTYQIAAAAAA